MVELRSYRRRLRLDGLNAGDIPANLQAVLDSELIGTGPGDSEAQGP
jgi:hypothetical protein